MNRRLFLFVLSIHCVWLLVVWQSPPPRPSVKKIVVHTKTIPKTLTNKAVPKAVPAAKPKASANKVVPKPLPKKKAPPKTNKARELLHQLESNMATMESNLKKVDESKPFDPIQITYESALPSGESYFETITTLFRQSLLLPEMGAVKVTITVQPNGEIAKIESISVKSDENLRYLEKTLPHLLLPPPPGGLPFAVTITFCESSS